MADQDPQESPKEVAFYSAVVQAWVATRMEKDRTILGLASAGIGLLATLLKTAGASSTTEIVLYALAGVSFVVTVVAAIRVYDLNSHHLADVIRNNELGDDPTLRRLDRVVFTFFVVGVVLTGVIALHSGFAGMRKDASMNHEEDRGTTKVMIDTEQKSLTGIGNLAPTPRPATGSPAPTSSSNQQGTDNAGAAASGKRLPK